MATVIENNCVDCQLPCINCGRKHQEVVKCDADYCDNYAHYTVSGADDGDYCRDCLEDLLLTVFKDLSLNEQIDVLRDYIKVQEI